MKADYKRYAGDWREQLAYFCKGYITAYTKTGIYHVHDNSKAWRFGFWLGGGQRTGAN